MRENSGETRMGRRRTRLKRGCGGSFMGGVAACGGEEVGGGGGVGVQRAERRQVEGQRPKFRMERERMRQREKKRGRHKEGKSHVK